MTSTSPEEQLPEQVFRELFHAHAPTVRRYIHPRIDDVEERGEVFQQVWLRFFAYMQKNPVDNVGGFLVALAMRRVKDWYGRSVKCEKASDAIGTSGTGDPLVHRENELLIRQLPRGTGDVELRLDLAKALCELTPEDRLVLSLTYVDRLTNREVGVVLGVSQQCVNQRLHRALGQLRVSEHLKNYGYDGNREVWE
ncbi:sigma-70 family RNA polymerase sigma factor [Lentzea sp. BCCO 10_0856]|uniref:Sigma-70 family RNA polymerase sigma factor n=1 Tax=Lentzea miocenica TaxID=3095431 RepID=A0ABU4TFF3_9PSEU|nr:sigma-70 family RNA polymerase sigma factor [Lentzea sp. BCCO 10_0856]MDX8036920.1 sigma-70 family RNA polymerase sigma factor [Lentzea sp. BCCO 10_0856]